MNFKEANPKVRKMITSVTGTVTVKRSDGSSKTYSASDQSELIRLVRSLVTVRSEGFEYVVPEMFKKECLVKTGSMDDRVSGEDVITLFEEWKAKKHHQKGKWRNILFRILREDGDIVALRPKNKLVFCGVIFSKKYADRFASGGSGDDLL